MNPQTFRNWLCERGCTFEETSRGRGQGVASVVVRREGRRSEMPYAASTNIDLQEEDVRRIVDELELPFGDLPGPQSRR